MVRRILIDANLATGAKVSSKSIFSMSYYPNFVPHNDPIFHPAYS